VFLAPSRLHTLTNASSKFWKRAIEKWTPGWRRRWTFTCHSMAGLSIKWLLLKNLVQVSKLEANKLLWGFWQQVKSRWIIKINILTNTSVLDVIRTTSNRKN
jgi:hypothetical protein